MTYSFVKIILISHLTYVKTNMCSNNCKTQLTKKWWGSCNFALGSSFFMLWYENEITVDIFGKISVVGLTSHDMEIPSVNCVLYMYLFLRIHLVRTGSSLDFSRNNLTEVPSAPNNMTVTEIDLKNNFIQEIRRNAFRNYTELANINLDGNGLQVIHDRVFDHISTLRVISLQRNDIIKLPTDFGPSTTLLGKFLLTDAIADTHILTHPYFGAFTSLGELTLHGCNIGNIDNSFLPPKIYLLLLGTGTADKFPLLSNSSPSLSWISMPNQKFKSIPEEAVAGLLRLGFLKLKNNEINNFPNFSHCKLLTHVYLENNKIPHISREHIKGLDRIRVMCLHHNSLTNMTDISNLT